MDTPFPSLSGLRRLGTMLLAMVLLGGCAATPEAPSTAGALRLPPIVDPPTRRYHPGKFVWHDLLTPDTVAARAFYGELFGWSFREKEGYIEIYNGRRKIGGMLQIRPREERKVEARWLAAMSVSDVDGAAAQVRSDGGRIINGPMELGERGRALLVEDPHGGQLLLLHSAAGDPADRRPGIGDWLWNEAWTLDPEPLVDFYRPLGHYGKVLRGEDYVVLLNEGHWRAGIRRIESRAYAGRWVPVIRVADPSALLEKVESLGGVVWVEPGPEKNGRRTALISDNAGALLILQQWKFGGEEE